MEGAMSDLYEQDFITGTEQQAQLLREAAAQTINLPLDWRHIAEEIEDLGRSEYLALAGQVARLIEHLLKLEFSPALQPRLGWMDTVAQARDAIERSLEDDPGVRARLAEILRKEAPRATRSAVAALHRFGEDAAASRAKAADGSRYSENQLLSDWLPERPDLS
jgi:hypothetical protein